MIENNTISGVEKLGPRRLDNAIRDIYGDSEGFRVVGNEIYWASSCMNHVVAGGLIERNYCHDMGFNTRHGRGPHERRADRGFDRDAADVP